MLRGRLVWLIRVFRLVRCFWLPWVYWTGSVAVGVVAATPELATLHLSLFCNLLSIGFPHFGHNGAPLDVACALRASSRSAVIFSVNPPDWRKLSSLPSIWACSILFSRRQSISSALATMMGSSKSSQRLNLLFWASICLAASCR